MTTSVQSESVELLPSAPMAVDAGSSDVATPLSEMAVDATQAADSTAEPIVLPPLLPGLVATDDSAYKVFLDIQKIIEKIGTSEEKTDVVQIIQEMQEVLDNLTLEEYLTLSNTPPLPTKIGTATYPSVIRQVEDYINILMDHIEKVTVSNTKVSQASLKEAIGRITPMIPKGFFYV